MLNFYAKCIFFILYTIILSLMLNMIKKQFYYLTYYYNIILHIYNIILLTVHILDIFILGIIINFIFLYNLYGTPMYNLLI